MPTDVRRLLAEELALADDDPRVGGELQRLCRAMVRALPAAGVGVCLMSPAGEPVSTTASDPVSRAVEELQFVLGEGPCQEAFADCRPVLVPDLMENGGARWPGYAPAASSRGVAAVFALPLQVGAARIGVLDVYCRHVGSLSSAALDLALSCADLAVELLLDAQQEADEFRTAPAVDDALGAGFELYQAQGMVMYQLGVDIGEAMSRLRAHAFANDRSLADVAADIVDRRLVMEADSPEDGAAPDNGNGRSA